MTKYKLEQTIAFIDMIHADYYVKLERLKETKGDSLIVKKLELESQFLLISAALNNLKGTL